jgi:hypothetical protein
MSRVVCHHLRPTSWIWGANFHVSSMPILYCWIYINALLLVFYSFIYASSKLIWLCPLASITYAGILLCSDLRVEHRQNSRQLMQKHWLNVCKNVHACSMQGKFSSTQRISSQLWKAFFNSSLDVTIAAAKWVFCLEYRWRVFPTSSAFRHFSSFAFWSTCLGLWSLRSLTW